VVIPKINGIVVRGVIPFRGAEVLRCWHPKRGKFLLVRKGGVVSNPVSDLESAFRLCGRLGR
jgi:hypothetical protein